MHKGEREELERVELDEKAKKKKKKKKNQLQEKKTDSRTLFQLCLFV